MTPSHPRDVILTGIVMLTGIHSLGMMSPSSLSLAGLNRRADLNSQEICVRVRKTRSKH